MDCYLPADFFLVDDVRRHDDIDPTLGADAHVHLESPAFVGGLRDWRNAPAPSPEPSRPRGRYPGSRHSRAGGNPGAMHRGVAHLGPRFRGDDDAEWRPL